MLCEISSGSEILLGEGGDVELGARTSKQISVFAIGLLVLITFYSFILILSIILSQQDCIRTSNSYLEELRGRSSKPFTGYTASNLTLSDRCIISFLICASFVY